MFIVGILRLLYRAPAALLWTLLVHWFLIRLPQIFSPGKRYLGSLSLWGSGLAFIMGVRIIEKNQRMDPMGDLIIANHMGFLDVPALLKFFPAVFVIKMEMRRVFYFGNALKRQGHVFVDRKSRESTKQAGAELLEVLDKGDRVIVFPEGRASPGAERLPFKPGSFASAERLGKRVQACVIDYLPDRKQLEWDVKKAMLPQLVKLLGRHRTYLSVEFFPSEEVNGPPAEYARKWHDIIQGRLEQYDRDRGAQEAS